MLSVSVRPKRPRYDKCNRTKRFRGTIRHNVDVDDDQWEIATRIGEMMQPPMKPSVLIHWLLDEGLKREWEAAIAAGAIVVDNPKP